MSYPDLFPALHNRMTQENQDVPEFIGEFDSVESLPKGDYPAIYFWIDNQLEGQVRLSFNTPKLENWCVEEARLQGISVEATQPAVQTAVATVQKVAIPAFEEMVKHMNGSQNHLSENGSANNQSKPWWRIW